MSRTEYYARAAMLALYLREVRRLAPEEAATLVMERYPATRPQLEKLTRRAVLGPLRAAETKAS